MTVSRVTGSSSSRSTKRKWSEVEAQEEAGQAEEQLLVSEEATSTGSVSICPTDMDGTSVKLTNETDQVSGSGAPPHSGGLFSFHEGGVTRVLVGEPGVLIGFAPPSLCRTSLWAAGG